MIGLILDVLSWILLLTGSVLLLTGGIGLLRLPDFYSRLQAAGMTDTLCAISILTGLALQAESFTVIVKLGFALVFLLFTAPLASHAIAKAARHGRLPIWRRADRENASSPR